MHRGTSCCLLESPGTHPLPPERLRKQVHGRLQRGRGRLSARAGAVQTLLPERLRPELQLQQPRQQHGLADVLAGEQRPQARRQRLGQLCRNAWPAQRLCPKTLLGRRHTRQPAKAPGAPSAAPPAAPQRPPRPAPVPQNPLGSTPCPAPMSQTLWVKSIRCPACGCSS